MEVALRAPSELSAEDRDAWRAFQAADPSLASPYFSLGFLDVMAAARRDVRVVCASRNGAPLAFLPLHVSPLGHARPLGGPLGDHHGLIAAPGAAPDLSELMRRSGAGVFDYHSGLGVQPSFRERALDTEGSWVIDLSDGYDAFVAARSAVEAKAFRNIRGRRRKIDAEGAVFRLHDDRPEVFEQALKWKSAQYRASGHFDVFSVAWPRRVLEGLLRCEDPDCRGVMSSLEIGGRLAAVHIGMRSQSVLHYWFPVYDPDLAKFGPGLALLLDICRAVSADGVREVHLGPGDYDFKAHLAAWQFPIVSGYAGSGLPALVRGAAAALEHGAERLPLGRAAYWPGKAFRRLDALTSFRAA